MPSWPGFYSNDLTRRPARPNWRETIPFVPHVLRAQSYFLSVMAKSLQFRGSSNRKFEPAAAGGSEGSSAFVSRCAELEHQSTRSRRRQRHPRRTRSTSAVC